MILSALFFSLLPVFFPVFTRQIARYPEKQTGNNSQTEAEQKFVRQALKKENFKRFCNNFILKILGFIKNIIFAKIKILTIINTNLL